MKNLLFILLSLSLSISKAQNPVITWQKTYGGSGHDYGYSLIQIEGTNELIIIGSSDSDISGEKTENKKGIADIWVIKTDAIGNIIWDKTIGGSKNNSISLNAILTDGLIYILANSDSPISGDKTAVNYGLRDFWLICMTVEGDILWDKTYGGDSHETATHLIELLNGNLLLLGNTSSGISGNKTSALIGLDDYWIIEVSPIDGAIIQQKGIGCSEYSTAASCVIDADGNIYVLSYASTGVGGDKTDIGYGSRDMWVVKLDADFNVLADKCFGGDNMEYFNGDLLIKNDALYLLLDSQSGISGNKTAPHYGELDYWLVKTDLNLNKIWDKSYGGKYTENGNSIIDFSHDKIVITGSSNSSVSGNKTTTRFGAWDDIWLLMIDEDGNILVQESYGGMSREGHRSTITDKHGNLFVLGFSGSDIGGFKTEDCRGEMDYWLLKLDASDFLSIPEHADDLLLTVYPNPFQDIVHFNFGEHHEPIQLSIYSIDGQRVFHQEFSPGINSFDWQTTATTTAVYIYEVITTHTIRTGKIVRGN